MYVIVIGCGRVGSNLANFLATEGHDVVVIDKDSRSFRRLGSTFNGLTVEGVGFDEETLKNAGVEKADALAAVTDLDNTNLMIAEVATRIFNVPRVVARLYNPERERTYQKLDISYVCGTILVAEKILDKIVEGYARHVSISMDTEVIEFKISDMLEGKKVEEIEMPGEFQVVAVTREGGSTIPTGGFVLAQGDIIVGVVKRRIIPKIEKFMV
ncbi:MAG: NAD-binding protein [Candidatus Subteraquimicrobiales bacterium]|nr:NAD-binding protein [Candidatus Subteraquimicrobiales bacterium]